MKINVAPEGDWPVKGSPWSDVWAALDIHGRVAVEELEEWEVRLLVSAAHEHMRRRYKHVVTRRRREDNGLYSVLLEERP